MLKSEQKKLKEVAILYGSHMAMRLATERAIISHEEKLHGKPTNHALNIHMGLYDQFTPEDWLNDPYMTPEFDRVDKRVKIEKKFGIV